MSSAPEEMILKNEIFAQNEGLLNIMNPKSHRRLVYQIIFFLHKYGPYPSSYSTMQTNRNNIIPPKCVK